MKEVAMQSTKFSRWLSIIMLASIIWGLLSGCASPVSETPLPEKATKPKSTEAPPMPPTDAPTQETEPSQSADDIPEAESPETGAVPARVAHSAKERDLQPNIGETELQELAAGNRAFAGRGRPVYCNNGRIIHTLLPRRNLIFYQDLRRRQGFFAIFA